MCFWRRNVILREDHSQIRTGAIPQVMAALRNAMRHIVRIEPGPLAATKETFAENRTAAITTLQQVFLQMTFAGVQDRLPSQLDRAHALTGGIATSVKTTVLPGGTAPLDRMVIDSRRVRPETHAGWKRP